MFGSVSDGALVVRAVVSVAAAGTAPAALSRDAAALSLGLQAASSTGAATARVRNVAWWTFM